MEIDIYSVYIYITYLLHPITKTWIGKVSREARGGIGIVVLICSNQLLLIQYESMEQSNINPISNMNSMKKIHQSILNLS